MREKTEMVWSFAKPLVKNQTIFASKNISVQYMINQKLREFGSFFHEYYDSAV